ncbi:MAG: hypothetical protein WCF59_07550 [Desulfobaccales bacterium]|jgi:hypothetical protein
MTGVYLGDDLGIEKKWRFMPAIRSGKPVATTEESLVKIEVK